MSNPLSPRATGTDVRARVAADDESRHDVLHAALCAVQRSETTKHESCSVVASATHMNILPTQPPSTHQMDSGQGGSRPADGRPPHTITLGRGSLPLPLCGACPFVGYCGLFSINYFRKTHDRGIGKPAQL